MIGDSGAQVLDWLAGWLAWLGDQAEDLFGEVVGWVGDLGVSAYALGGVVVLLWLVFALWYSSRR